MNKVLLLEDDHNLGLIIQEHLLENKYEVFWAKNVENAREIIHARPIDLGILDVMLPDGDGFSFCEEIRTQNYELPIVFLTARTLQEDRIKGLRSGADDYLTKPFSMEELLLRLRALLRRSYPNSPTEQVLKIGKYQFEPHALLLTYQDKSPKKLTEKEAALLSLLVKKQNTVVKRSEILTSIWGQDDYFMGRSLDVFISRLRKYLKNDSGIQIENYHGIGFMLRNQV